MKKNFRIGSLVLHNDKDDPAIGIVVAIENVSSNSKIHNMYFKQLAHRDAAICWLDSGSTTYESQKTFTVISF